MAAAKKIICPSCGFKNTAPLPNNRCVSCGAKIEDLKRAMSRQEELERRYQQEGFSIGWFVISIVIMSVLTAAIVMGLADGGAGVRLRGVGRHAGRDPGLVHGRECWSV